MRNTSLRWRRLVDLVLVLAGMAFVARRRRERATGAATDTAVTADGDGPPEMEVELERLNVGDDLSVATPGLDPTLVADVLELNEGAADLVDAAEEGFIRDPIETATGAEVPDVEDELARRVRESTVSETAIDELDTLGSLFGFGSRRRRRRRHEREGDADGTTAADADDDADE